MIKTTNLKNTSVAWMPEIPSNWDLMRGKFLFKSRKVINDKMQCNDRLGLTLRGVIDRFEGDGVGLNPNDLRTYQIFNENELVFKLIDLENKNTSRVGFVHKRGIMSSAYIRVMNNANVNMRYFYYQYYNLYQRFIFNMIGQGVRATMSSSDLLNIPVAIPPLEVQNRIVAYLDKKNNKIDQFIRNKERLIEILEELKKDVIDNAFTKGLNSNVEFKTTVIDCLTNLPKHWSLKRLKFLTKIISKGSTPSTEGREMTTEGIRFIKAENIYKSNVTEEPAFFIDEVTHRILKRSQLQENDLLFVIAGATIGKVAIMLNEFLPANTNQAVSFIRLKKKIDVEFCYYWLHSNSITTSIWLKAVTSAQPNLAMEDLGNLSIPYPSDIEKEEIVKYVKKEHQTIDLAISKAQKEITSIKEYREALITDLVTGKRSIPEPQRI